MSAAEPSDFVSPGALSALIAELVHAPEPGGQWSRGLRPGDVVAGRFEIVRELGRGGFGVVYQARDLQLSRSVAFKAVRAGEQAALREERLVREAESAARLSHPNIVTLHDVGHCEHGPYLVLELLKGKTLSVRFAQGPLSVRETLRVAVKVAEGLAHAHRQGVFHRDLTPGNIFLCDDGQVKILDFGLAHAFGQRRADGGTPAYMAPEQWRGAPEDERTDVFALGVILHRALCGALPFPEDDAGKEATSPRPAPSLEVPQAPSLGSLVGRLLEKDPVFGRATAPRCFPRSPRSKRSWSGRPRQLSLRSGGSRVAVSFPWAPPPRRRWCCRASLCGRCTPGEGPLPRALR